MVKWKTLGIVIFISLLSSIGLEIFQHGTASMSQVLSLNFESIQLIAVYTFIYSVILLVFITLFRFLAKIL